MILFVFICRKATKNSKSGNFRFFFVFFAYSLFARTKGLVPPITIFNTVENDGQDLEIAKREFEPESIGIRRKKMWKKMRKVIHIHI